ERLALLGPRLHLAPTAVLPEMAMRARVLRPPDARVSSEFFCWSRIGRCFRRWTRGRRRYPAPEDRPSLQEFLPGDLPSGVPVLEHPDRVGRAGPVLAVRVVMAAPDQAHDEHDDYDPKRHPQEAPDDPPAGTPSRPVVVPHHSGLMRSLRIRASSSAVISPRANRSSATRMDGVEDGPVGSTIHRMMYARTPHPISAATTNPTRTSVASMPK